jgi:hypothetical protein
MEATAALPLRDSPAETRFDNGLHGCSLPVCQFSHLFIKIIWYLYGCLHMVNHIKLYGQMASESGKEYQRKLKRAEGKKLNDE